MSSFETFFAGAFTGGGITFALMFMIFWLTESEDDHDEDI